MKKYENILDATLRERMQKIEDKKQDSFKKRVYFPFFKRTADIFCSLVALAILLVMFPFIAIAIKLDSKGPIIFKQLRVGQRGQLFMLYKLRTMRNDAESLGDELMLLSNNRQFLQQENDPRVTRVGRFLRRYSIDELPQLFCVFAGTMSFIGPRPFIPAETRQLDEEQLMRLTVKPGLTGLAQISGRNNLSLEERIEKDLEYIDTMSAWLDIKILWITFIKILRHEGAS